MVEFALVLPVLCAILFATVQFGTVFWQYQQLSAAASEGARRAAVSRTFSDRTTRVTNSVKTAAPGLTSTKVTVQTDSTWAAGSSVTVTAKYPATIKIMGRTLYNKDLTSRRTARVEV